MEIKVQVFFNKGEYCSSIIVDKNDSVEYLKEKIIKNIFKNFPHYNHFFRIRSKKLGGRRIKELRTGLLKDYHIDERNIILIDFSHNEGGGYIDNLKDESETTLEKR